MYISTISSCAFIRLTVSTVRLFQLHDHQSCVAVAAIGGCITIGVVSLSDLRYCWSNLTIEVVLLLELCCYQSCVVIGVVLLLELCYHWSCHIHVSSIAAGFVLLSRLFYY